MHPQGGRISKWLQNPYLLGVPKVGGISMWQQNLCVLGPPGKWKISKWLHNPYLFGVPQNGGGYHNAYMTLAFLGSPKWGSGGK